MDLGELSEEVFILDVEAWSLVVLGGKHDDGIELFALQQSLNLVVVFVLQVEPLKAL